MNDDAYTRVHVTKSVTIPTGRFRSARFEYGVATSLRGTQKDATLRAEYRRLRTLVDRELRLEKRRIRKEEDE